VGIARKETHKFGRMMVTPILQVGADADLQTAITSLLWAAERPRSVASLHPRPQNRNLAWYSVDFDDKQYGGNGALPITPIFRQVSTCSG